MSWKVCVWKLIAPKDGSFEPYLERQSMMENVYVSKENAVSYLTALCAMEPMAVCRLEGSD